MSSSISRRSRAVAIVLAAVSAAAAFWFVLAPRQVGGAVDYAVIHGVSMEPKLHAGDLALIRSQPAYSVGQVVGYQSRLLHELVLHRIIGEKNGRYLFKGDNNNFVDSYYPTRNELVGRLWFRIPYAGGSVAWLRVPRHAAFLGALIALLVAAGGGTVRARRGMRRQLEDETEPHHRSRRPLTAVSSRAPVVLACALIAASGFVLLTVVGFTRPSRQTVTDTSAYEQSTVYTYRAAAPRTTVYPSGVVRTGDPIFMNLVRRLRLDLRYAFSSALPHAVGGTISLEARLRSGGGWTQLLAAAPAHVFRGGRATTSVQLDLAHLRSEMRAFRSEADISNENFVLVIASRVRLRGIIAGRRLATAFTPTPLTFNTDDQSVELAQAPAVGGAVGAATPDPLKTTQTGSAERPEAASLSLLGLRIRRETAREIGFAGTVAALLVAAAALALLRRRDEVDELSLIRHRYSSWLIPVSTPLVGPNVVDVASIDSLVSLAAHYDSPILYEQREHSHLFAVEEAGRLYRYRLGDERLGSTPLRSRSAPEQPAGSDAQTPTSLVS
jgi:signal peptidase I